MTISSLVVSVATSSHDDWYDDEYRTCHDEQSSNIEQPALRLARSGNNRFHGLRSSFNFNRLRATLSSYVCRLRVYHRQHIKKSFFSLTMILLLQQYSYGAVFTVYRYVEEISSSRRSSSRPFLWIYPSRTRRYRRQLTRRHTLQLS